MKIYRALFAATVAAFNMANFGSLFGAMGFYVRYVSLVLLLLGTVIYASKQHVRIPPGVLATFYVFMTYAFVTTFWSENFALSALKWVIYVLLVAVILVSGISIADLKDENPFWPLKWVFVPVVLVSLVALLRGIGWFAGNFRGYCGNSNALAATIVLASPWLLYELWLHWSRKRYRMALLALSAGSALVIVCTFSRAAMGAMLIITTFAGWNLKLGKKFVITYAMLLLVIAVYLVRPSAYNAIYSSIVEKRSENVLSSRSEQLMDSWEAAKKGGAFGVGFGISTGESRYWNMQSFSSFAREKGNSMFAIAEELGVVGIVLYLGLLYAIWASLRQYSRSLDSAGKFLYRLSLGFFFGALFHSAFEAWFLSSGPDVSIFWATLGLATGTLTLRYRQSNDRLHRVEASPRAGIFVAAPSSRR